jgi:Skp family chaperone for outer membrane proteins
MKKSSLLLIASVLVMTAAASAQAATPAAPSVQAAPAMSAPAVVPPTFGAAIPGQCVLDEQAALASSKMGQAASGRLTQLAAMVKAELSPDNDRLNATVAALSAQQKAATTPALQKALDAKVQAFYADRDAFQKKADLRQQEMQATQQQVLQRIFQEMIPQINAVVTQRGCSTVTSADSLVHYEMGTPQSPSNFLYVNPSMDITQAVVAKMDATGEILPAFERAHLDPSQAGASGGQ